MAFRVPPPVIYQNEEARLTATRKDYRDRHRNGSIALRAAGGAARAVSWPLRTAWRLVRPIG